MEPRLARDADASFEHALRHIHSSYRKQNTQRDDMSEGAQKASQFYFGKVARKTNRRISQ
jgi:hypothetical protein